MNSPTNFSHKQAAKIGVLLCNLGSPDAPETGAVRRYLQQFLSDPRVVEIPRLLWWFILHGLILRLRPPRSAKLYKKIWMEQGSPLTHYTREQAAALSAVLREDFGEQIEVSWAMRYGQPAIDKMLQKLADKNVQKLLVLPLYPQYSASTTASVFDALAKDFKRRRWLPELRFVSSYHDFPDYIEALAQSVEQHWAKQGRAEKLLLSFHGVPQRFLRKGDPYHCHCLVSSRLLIERLGLSADDYEVTFQSRFGREPWLQPYTDKKLIELAAQGVSSVQIVCPGFSADCLETLEEICHENRQLFLENGGQRFEYIEALNARAEHIQALRALIKSKIGDWQQAPNPLELAQREERYAQHPHNRK